MFVFCSVFSFSLFLSLSVSLSFSCSFSFSFSPSLSLSSLSFFLSLFLSQFFVFVFISFSVFFLLFLFIFTIFACFFVFSFCFSFLFFVVLSSLLLHFSSLFLFLLCLFVFFERMDFHCRLKVWKKMPSGDALLVYIGLHAASPQEKNWTLHSKNKQKHVTGCHFGSSGLRSEESSFSHSGRMAWQIKVRDPRRIGNTRQTWQKMKRAHWRPMFAYVYVFWRFWPQPRR